MKCLVPSCAEPALGRVQEGFPPYCAAHDRTITMVYVEPDVKSRDMLMCFVRYCEDNPGMSFTTAIKSFLYERGIAC